MLTEHYIDGVRICVIMPFDPSFVEGEPSFVRAAETSFSFGISFS